MPQGVSRVTVRSCRSIDEYVHGVWEIEMKSGRTCVIVVVNRSQHIIHFRTFNHGSVTLVYGRQSNHLSQEYLHYLGSVRQDSLPR